MLGVYRDPTCSGRCPASSLVCFCCAPASANRDRRRSHALVLLAAPFVYTLSSLFIYDDADERGDTLLALWPLLLILAAALALFNLFKLRRSPNLRAFLPIVLLVAINGAFMSQQLWGSTYAIWPLLILLIAEMLAFLADPSRSSPIDCASRSLAPTMRRRRLRNSPRLRRLLHGQRRAPLLRAVPRWAGGTFRLPAACRHVHARPLPARFRRTPALRRRNIPVSDGLILLPGEDPFYFATGRTPQFPVLLFDPATDPYSPAQVVDASPPPPDSLADRETQFADERRPHPAARSHAEAR